MHRDIKVCIRFSNQPNSDWHFIDHNICYLGSNFDNKYCFTFDRVFQPETTQEQIYDTLVADRIKLFVHGFNAAFITYGATQSGKTHTILGSNILVQSLISSITNDSQNIVLGSDAGILPRSFFDIMNFKQDGQIKISYVEIIKEQIYDLLSDEDKPLKIRETAEGIEIIGAEKKNIEDLSNLFEWLAYACSNTRNSNARSTIFIIEYSQEGQKSKLFFTDLHSQDSKDTKSIGLSLFQLGQCILALSNSKRKLPTFRESKLTFLLKDCLKGDYMTYFICTVNADQEEESLRTIRFAQRAKSINSKFNIEQMEKEIQQLSQQVKEMHNFISRNGLNYDKSQPKQQQQEIQQNIIQVDSEDEELSDMEKQQILSYESQEESDDEQNQKPKLLVNNIDSNCVQIKMKQKLQSYLGLDESGSPKNILDQRKSLQKRYSIESKTKEDNSEKLKQQIKNLSEDNQQLKEKLQRYEDKREQDYYDQFAKSKCDIGTIFMKAIEIGGIKLVDKLQESIGIQE